MHLVTPQTNTTPSSHQITMQYLLAVLLTLPILNNYTIGTVDGKQVNIQTNPYGYTTGTIDGKQVYIQATPQPTSKNQKPYINPYEKPQNNINRK